MYEFTEIEADKLQLARGVKVLKAAEYNRYLGSTDLLEAAQQKAHQIESDAVQAFEAAKVKGYEEGLAASKKEHAHAMLATLKACNRFYDESLEDFSKVIMSGVKTILGKFDDVELTLLLAQQAIRSVTNQRQVTFHVNPDQVDLVKQKIGKALKDFPEISYVEVNGDDRIESSGCLLETKAGVIDASLESQLQALQESLQQPTQ
jgi:type III secretion protein L